MAIEVVIPRLGWSMDEGIFSEWLKQDGQWVTKGDMLFVLEGEKAAQEIESFDEGVLRIPANAPKTGETVKVGQVIGYLVAEGEAFTPPDAITTPTASTSTPSNVRPVAGPAVRRLARNLGVDLGQVAGSGRGGRITSEDVQSSVCKPLAAATGAALPHRAGARISTPRARRVARELGVDLFAAVGSGRGGRIREQDVRALASEQPTNGSARRAAIRKSIAARMMASFHGGAPVTLTTRADTSNLEVWRAQRKAQAAAGQAVPTITDVLIQAAAAALRAHPAINARWERDRVQCSQEIHLGIAVDTEAGLLVPVLRDVGQLTLDQIARQSRELAERARSGQLTMNQLQGGTFTISNLGMYGIDAFTPIINAPEIAILGVGAIRREVVVTSDDRFEARSMMTLSLTFDHRAIDGAPAARFLQTLCRLIENPAAWIQ